MPFVCSFQAVCTQGQVFLTCYMSTKLTIYVKLCLHYQADLRLRTTDDRILIFVTRLHVFLQ